MINNDLIDPDMEVRLIARMIGQSEIINMAHKVLEPEDFGIVTNQLIFQATKKVGSDIQAIKSVVGMNELYRTAKTQEDLNDYFDGLANACIDGDINNDIKIIKELSTRRKMVEACQKSAIMARDLSASVSDGLRMTSKLFNVATKKYAGIETKPIDPLDSLNQILEASASNGIFGTPTGYTRLDQCTKGLRKGYFSVIGGEPSAGKTTLVINQVVNLLKDQPNKSEIPSVGIIALESTHAGLEIAFGTNFLGYELLRPGITEDEIDRYVRFLDRYRSKPLKVYTQENGSNTPQAILAVIDEWIEQGVKIIYVDNISTIQFGGTSADMRLAVASFASELKRRCTESGVHITALTHVTRQAGKEPVMKDLSESAALERLADNVQLVYLLDPDQAEESNRDKTGVEYTDIMIKVAKARGGKRRKIPYRFYFPLNRIVEFYEDGRLETLVNNRKQ